MSTPKKTEKLFIEDFLYIMHKNICIIPVHLNLCFFPYTNTDDPDNIGNKNQSISFFYTHFRSYLSKKISEFINKSNCKTFVIDMARVTNYTHHEVFDKFFASVKKAKKEIFFINISKEGFLKKRIQTDLLYAGFEIDKDLKLFDRHIFLSNDITDVGENKTNQVNKIYAEIEIQKIADCLLDKQSFLESSNIFLSKYLHLKRLFLSSAATMFVCYRLCCKLEENEKHKNVPLISGSSTGNVIATILATLTDREILHCSNIGPRFGIKIRTLPLKIMDKKNKGRDYIYIFDMICLGTEIKILNSMLKMNDSKIIACFGVASYLDKAKVKGKRKELLDKEKNNLSKEEYILRGKNINENGLEKIECLFILNEENSKYRVSINEI